MKITTKVGDEFKTFSCVADYDRYRRDVLLVRLTGIGALLGALVIIIGMFTY
jgi:hypothetical protein